MKFGEIEPENLNVNEIPFVDTDGIIRGDAHFTFEKTTNTLVLGQPGGPEGYGYGYGEEGTSIGSLILYGDLYVDNDTVFAEDVIIGGSLTVNGKLTVTGLIDPTGLELTPVAANPGGVAANTLWINSNDSNKLYFGAAEVGTTYDTLWIGAGAMTPSETAGASFETVEYTGNNVTHDVMRFSGADNDTHVEFNVAMPEQWNHGTIKIKIYWTAGGDAGVDEYVGFYIAAGALSDGDSIDAALGTAVTVADQLIADDDVHITAASSAITVGGTPALGDMIHFKLSRDYDYSGDGTAMDVDADVLGILIQYKRSEMASAW